MLVVKRNYLPSLNRPLRLSLFGKNKTLRGLILMTVINGAVCASIFSWKDGAVIVHFLKGALLGVTYILSELPNSYLKRKAGIPSGQTGSGALSLFVILDKTDSALGVSIAYYFLTPISCKEMLIIFMIGSSMHVILSYLFYQLKIKAAF
jgi:CDP-diglyceride synthetase